MKERERERERERDCPAMLLLFSTAYRAAASWLRSLFFRELGLTSTACLMLYMTS